ncbi:MAG: hypothetical protein ACKN9T_18570 [Candidatus Methylumidiphilus sp.]
MVVEIQGIRLETPSIGASCVEIAGDYPSVKVEASEAGKTARVCYSSNKINSIAILNATFIALEPTKKDVLIQFEHNFPSGLNGKVMARAKLQGFFSASDGVGVPSGDKLALASFFSQNSHDDAIAEPYAVTVGEDMDSALFDYAAKKRYLISGPRALKGSLKIYFAKAGHKLTLEDKSALTIDTGSTMADKLDLMAPVEEGVSPPSPEGVQLDAPVGPIALPPAGSETPPSP